MIYVLAKVITETYSYMTERMGIPAEKRKTISMKNESNVIQLPVLAIA
jgi:hypothetical protein